jgi:HEAT repeat protein
MYRPMTIAAMCVALVAGCGSTPHGVKHAEHLLATGDYDGAREAADTELRRFPEHPTLWRVKIQAALRAGDHAGAVDLYMEWHKLRRHYDEAALGEMAETTIWRGLADNDAAVRAQSISAIDERKLGGLRHHLSSLLDDEIDAVSVAAAVALLGDDARAREIAERHASADDPSVRRAAVSGLGVKLKGDARSVVIDALDDESAGVRTAAVGALGLFASADDRARLSTIAVEDTDGKVRARALRSLAKSQDGDLFELSNAALADEFVGVRLAAVTLLARSKEGLAVLDGLLTSTDTFVALRAAVAIRKSGGPASTDTIERGLNDPSWSVRAAAVNAVAEVARAEDALRMLGVALNDDRMEVRLAAARVLMRLGHSGRAAQTFYTALEDPNEWSRVQAAIDLMRMDDSGGIDALATLATSKNPATRQAAVGAHRYADNVTLPLVTALGDTDGGVRVEAASTLLWLLD